ncbi:putative fatty acyl-CoA reductase 2-like [Capsicum annuum]|nr:putative fatty acyl-CoA reductase 2-like [Capsicum annuum]
MMFNHLITKVALNREKLYGWQDTYSFTKAIGEMIIDNMREDIPIVIIRPSVITRSYEEPFKDGYKDSGEYPCCFGDPSSLVDVVPVDVVVNTTTAAIAKHGHLQIPELNDVYHSTSSYMNPLSLSQLFNYCYEFFNSSPSVNSKGDQMKIKK